jgi:RimJ/RimL family protein N-acetyltransferase
LIRTPRLELIPCDLAMLRAIVSGRDVLAAHLGVAVPDGWPEFPEAYQHALELLDEHLDVGGWWTYVFVAPGEGALVGSGGFKGKPDADGVVEIGYEIAPSFRGRGFATEAAEGLTRFAFADAAVRSVIAHTLPRSNASTRVLDRIGMRHDGIAEDPEDGTVWRWRLDRS